MTTMKAIQLSLSLMGPQLIYVLAVLLIPTNSLPTPQPVGTVAKLSLPSRPDVSTILPGVLFIASIRGGDLYDSGPGEDDDELYDPYSYEEGVSEEDKLSRKELHKSRQRYHPRSKPRRTSTPVNNWATRLASNSLQLGTNLAWNTVQQTGKLAFRLIQPKYVDARELAGLWRLDQQVSLAKTTRQRRFQDDDQGLASVATVELEPRHQQVHLEVPSGKDGERTRLTESYTLKKTRWGTYETQFVAPAFLVGETPRLYGYRGTWQRKLADKSVIKLVGKIYLVRKQRFGREKGRYVFGQAVGTFVARRRVQLSDDDLEENEDDWINEDNEDSYEYDEDWEGEAEESYDTEEETHDEDGDLS